jgi:hypothetical protein
MKCRFLHCKTRQQGQVLQIPAVSYGTGAGLDPTDTPPNFCRFESSYSLPTIPVIVYTSHEYFKAKTLPTEVAFARP